MNSGSIIDIVGVFVNIIGVIATLVIGIIQISQGNNKGSSQTNINIGKLIIVNPTNEIIANNKIRVAILVFLVLQCFPNTWFLSGMGMALFRLTWGVICTIISLIPALYGFFLGLKTHDKNLRLLGIVTGFTALIPVLTTWIKYLIYIILIILGYQTGIFGNYLHTPTP
jgi:hypothetical protein